MKEDFHFTDKEFNESIKLADKIRGLFEEDNVKLHIGMLAALQLVVFIMKLTGNEKEIINCFVNTLWNDMRIHTDTNEQSETFH